MFVFFHCWSIDLKSEYLFSNCCKVANRTVRTIDDTVITIPIVSKTGCLLKLKNNKVFTFLFFNVII